MNKTLKLVAGLVALGLLFVFSVTRIEAAFDDGYGGYDSLLLPATSNDPSGLVLDPTNENYAYYASQDDDNVSKINLSNGETTIISDFGEFSPYAQQMTISPDGTSLFLALGWGSVDLIKIDTSTGEIDVLIDHGLPGTPNYVVNNGDSLTVTPNHDASILYLSRESNGVIYSYDLDESTSYAERFNFIAGTTTACTTYSLDCSGSRNLGDLEYGPVYLDLNGDNLIMNWEWEAIYSLNINSSSANYLDHTLLIDALSVHDFNSFEGAVMGYGDYIYTGQSYRPAETTVQNILKIDANTGAVVEELELFPGVNFDNCYNFGMDISSDGNKMIIANDGTNDSIIVLNLESADTTPPTFVTLPGVSAPINLTEGQTITTNPYIIKVKPNDDNGIQKVEFYVDNNLICTATTPDSDGVYSCSWDTSKYHSDIRVLAYDNSGNPSLALTRSTTVDPSLYTLPRTGMNLWDYVNYFANLIF